MKQGTKFAALMGMMGAMLGGTTMKSTHSFKDSNDVQGKDEGRQTPVFAFGSNSNPIYNPSRSQQIKSKRLAKRNAGR